MNKKSPSDSERELDRFLAAAEEPALSADLEQRLLALPARHRAPARLPFARRAFVLPALGWAAAAGFGLWLGAQSADDAGLDRATADAAALSDDGTLLELAQGALDDLEETP